MMTVIMRIAQIQVIFSMAYIVCIINEVQPSELPNMTKIPMINIRGPREYKFPTWVPDPKITCWVPPWKKKKNRKSFKFFADFEIKTFKKIFNFFIENV